jgi:FAD/FMN-containing dehydrogenase
MNKQKIVFLIVGFSVISILIFYKTHIIFDVSRLSPTIVTCIKSPQTIDELREIVTTADLPISIAGGRYSQGGQIACPLGIVIDTINLHEITHFDPDNRIISVQPGVTWKEIQKLIDPYNLSIQVMQSYNDFTVGGSLSVNVHGRDPQGSLIKTVESIKIMLANGKIVTASRTENSDLFYATLGGYGLLGVIVEAKLRLTENYPIQRSIQIMPIDEYPSYFFNTILNDSTIIFHNANIYPDEFKEVLAITWKKTTEPLTQQDRLQQHTTHIKAMIEEQILRRFSPAKKLRQQIEPKRLQEKEVVWRNYEMSYTVKSLEPLIRFPTTNILQEYFVPLDKLIEFINEFRSITHRYKVNVLNVSIRYVPADHESLLAYAPQNSFALVCYINVPRTVDQKKEREWTQKLIDAVLNVNGAFYLPYHLYATQQQFQQAYPHYKKFLQVKKRYDPHNRFISSLYESYMK